MALVEYGRNFKQTVILTYLDSDRFGVNRFRYDEKVGGKFTKHQQNEVLQYMGYAICDIKKMPSR